MGLNDKRKHRLYRKHSRWVVRRFGAGKDSPVNEVLRVFGIALEQLNDE